MKNNFRQGKRLLNRWNREISKKDQSVFENLDFENIQKYSETSKKTGRSN